MHAYALHHVGDRELLHNLAALVAHDCTTTASILAHIAEVDTRRLYRPAARKWLEYDHIDPVARGGEATVERMRLRCRAHNQYEADCTFGVGFMNEKREQARRATAAKRPQHEKATSTCPGASSHAQAEAHARAADAEHTQDVIKSLRELGCRAEEARRIAESCEHSPDATLEERVRAALKHLGPKPRFHGRVGATVGVQT